MPWQNPIWYPFACLSRLAVNSSTNLWSFICFIHSNIRCLTLLQSSDCSGHFCCCCNIYLSWTKVWQDCHRLCICFKDSVLWFFFPASWVMKVTHTLSSLSDESGSEEEVVDGQCCFPCDWGWRGPRSEVPFGVCGRSVILWLLVNNPASKRRLWVQSRNILKDAKVCLNELIKFEILLDW